MANVGFITLRPLVRSPMTVASSRMRAWTFLSIRLILSSAFDAIWIGPPKGLYACAFSKTLTSYPWLMRTRAVQRPPMPPPATITSAVRSRTTSSGTEANERRSADVRGCSSCSRSSAFICRAPLDAGGASGLRGPKARREPWAGTTAGPGTTAKPSPKSTSPPISAQAPEREIPLCEVLKGASRKFAVGGANGWRPVYKRGGRGRGRFFSLLSFAALVLLKSVTLSFAAHCVLTLYLGLASPQPENATTFDDLFRCWPRGLRGWRCSWRCRV